MKVFRLVLLIIVLPLLMAAVPPPPDLDRRAGFDQHVGAMLPTRTRLTDDHGVTRTLAEIADGKPLVLAFGYYRCPNLCDLTLHGIARAAATMPLVPGKDYGIVFAGVDPRETGTEAADARAMIARMEPGAHAEGWTFAEASNATPALAAAAGFRYFLDPRNGQYAHPAGLLVVTPDGHVSRYFFGVSFDPGALRLALVEASQGRLGGVIDRLVLLCCGYDPATGRYSLLVSRIMMVLGCAFVLLMIAGWLRLRRKAR
ncbi:SCO family protein [Luteibacter sp. CQ10]|uniref:SCO family protein n=1 Tax=Luteibacter sp. CQ10 TaxID=2805821 RepID=UPI0034A4EF41